MDAAKFIASQKDDERARADLWEAVQEFLDRKAQAPKGCIAFVRQRFDAACAIGGWADIHLKRREDVPADLREAFAVMQQANSMWMGRAVLAWVELWRERNDPSDE